MVEEYGRPIFRTAFPFSSGITLLSLGERGSMNNFQQWLGIVAGILTSCSMLPQVFKILKEKHSQQVSPWMIIVLMAGVALWIYYGVLREDWPIIITNSLSLLINFVLIILRFKYKHGGQMQDETLTEKENAHFSTGEKRA